MSMPVYDPYNAPWHRASYDRFLSETLPRLLGERLMLTGYRIEEVSPISARIVVEALWGDTSEQISYDEIPLCRQDGSFSISTFPETHTGENLVVVPVASSEDLSTAEVHCVGDQLEEFVTARLALVPGPGERMQAVSAADLRMWLPLNEWILNFFRTYSQRLDPTNWLATHAHLRRIRVEGEVEGFHPGQIGRTCIVETPEGPNIGRIMVLSRGATIEDRRIVVYDASPAGYLGLSAACIPFFEHSSDNRLLMGANMMRQWYPPPTGEAEPALVQTGLEPLSERVPDFWCGRNLLTAFVSWGEETHEDAVVVSQSTARRLGYPAPLEPGDKLSNRHGAKGIVGRILPDDEMPHLPDGTPVEICYSFTGLMSRLNHGQVLEAVLGRIAKAEGKPFVVAPFAAPDREEIKHRLVTLGFSPSGMETLHVGKGGVALELPSTVGWVYWGHLYHDARLKLQFVADDDSSRGQLIGPAEYRVLRDAGAIHTLHCLMNVQAQAPPSERFAQLRERLRAAGIGLSLNGERLETKVIEPEEEGRLRLSQPMRLPWMPGATITTLGLREDIPAADMVRSTQARLTRLESVGNGSVPPSLRERAVREMEAAVGKYLEELLSPEHLSIRERVRFSGRAVIAPGGRDLGIEQVILPAAIAWEFFGPLLLQEGKVTATSLANRDAEAKSALDARMAGSLVLVLRRSVPGSALMLALQPVCGEGNETVIRLHPLACPLLDADYDGDQAAVYLPLSNEAQEEMGRTLTIAARLTQDPDLLKETRLHAALVGLAVLSLTPDGKADLEAVLGIPLRTPNGFFDKAALDAALLTVYRQRGITETLATLERLYRRGFEVIKASGASFPPFVGETLVAELPPAPQENAPVSAWDAYFTAACERIAARAATGAFQGEDLSLLLLSVASGARGSSRHLTRYFATTGSSEEVSGKGRVAIPHCLRDGLTLAESITCAAGGRRIIRQMIVEHRLEPGDEEVLVRKDDPANPSAEGIHLLARAQRSPQPGMVFALAAQAGEIDPLTGTDSRLFVGLPPQV